MPFLPTDDFGQRQYYQNPNTALGPQRPETLADQLQKWYLEKLKKPWDEGEVAARRPPNSLGILDYLGNEMPNKLEAFKAGGAAKQTAEDDAQRAQFNDMIAQGLAESGYRETQAKKSAEAQRAQAQARLDAYMRLAEPEGLSTSPTGRPPLPQVPNRPAIEVPAAVEAVAPDYDAARMAMLAARPAPMEPRDALMGALGGALGGLAEPSSNPGQLIGRLAAGAAGGYQRESEAGRREKAQSERDLQEYYRARAGIESTQARDEAARQTANLEAKRGVKGEQNAEEVARNTTEFSRALQLYNSTLEAQRLEEEARKTNNSTLMAVAQNKLKALQLLSTAGDDNAALSSLSTAASKGNATIPGLNIAQLRVTAEAKADALAKAYPNSGFAIKGTSAYEKLIQQLEAQMLQEQLQGNPAALSMARRLYRQPGQGQSPLGND